jgi:hypothetical protein
VGEPVSFTSPRIGPGIFFPLLPRVSVLGLERGSDQHRERQRCSKGVFHSGLARPGHVGRKHASIVWVLNGFAYPHFLQVVSKLFRARGVFSPL